MRFPNFICFLSKASMIQGLLRILPLSPEEPLQEYVQRFQLPGLIASNLPVF